ncbi:hypothetical protein LTR04_006110 [Oleoguttula sp. CCFEE 6159]|nr:hypothetical protein LTR04_006110 [Oleoguttula sp. CCFEE 6159]
MLTEHFVLSVSAPSKAPSTPTVKDAGIFLYEHQPLAALRSTYKKSVTSQNCLAVSASHIFAAQAEKAVIHVYGREKANQEALIPFPERIRCVALACDDTILVLGTESGRLYLWEVCMLKSLERTTRRLMFGKTCTGRRVATPQSHLQPVTVLAVDSTSNFLLSGSADAEILIWSIPNLLSFSPPSSNRLSSEASIVSPSHRLSDHNGAITALVIGRSSSSANIAVSASKDNYIRVWDYRTGNLLRTFFALAPCCLALDPMDRAVYVGNEDGSIQLVDFFHPSDANLSVNTLRDSSHSQTAVDSDPTKRWVAQSQDLGACLGLSVSWDGSTLLSGHASGKVASWDVARGTYTSTITALSGSVTNLSYLPVSGFSTSTLPHSTQSRRDRSIKIHAVTKPRNDQLDTNESRVVQSDYKFTAQFLTQLPAFGASAISSPANKGTVFEEALTHPCFPTTMIEEGLTELATWNQPQTPSSLNDHASGGSGFMALDSAADATSLEMSAEQQNADLLEQIAALQRVQKVSLDQLEGLRQERKILVAEQREHRERQLAKEQRRSEKNRAALERREVVMEDDDDELGSEGEDGSQEMDSESD